MRIAVFGATGGTGAQVVDQALAAGHDVVALARDPAAITRGHDRLRVLRGDVLAPETVAPAVKDVDAVVSALGIGYRRHATTVYSDGTGNVVAAMRAAGVRRLLAVSTSSVQLPAPSRFGEWAVARFLLHPLLRKPYADIALMERQLGAADCDWTIVRAARLTNGPRTGKYRTATGSKLPGCWSISRADLAHYLLARLTDRAAYRATVEIAY